MKKSETKSKIAGVMLFIGTAIFAQTTNTFPENGNVGIGTKSPQRKLHVNGSILANGQIKATSLTIRGTPDSGMNISTTNSSVMIESNKPVHFTKNVFSSAFSSPYQKSLLLKVNGTEQVRIVPNGNVGIGTTTPDMKLTVNGNIHAKEVKVDLDVPAPDYVFKSDYKLKSIEQVEEFIKKNHHLPEIPSAKAFKQNGVMLSEMNMNLLKKVEELTLYIIQLNKKIKALESKKSKKVKSCK